MTFSSQPWAVRMVLGGDPAENSFRLFAKEKGWSVDHYGFDRSNLNSFWKLTEFVKSTPDFACVAKKRKEGFLVEAKGVGRAKYVKIKEHTMEGLREWNKHSDLFIFINDTHLHKYCFIPFDELDKAIREKQPKKDVFDGKKIYFEVLKEWFEWHDKVWEEKE